MKKESSSILSGQIKNENKLISLITLNKSLCVMLLIAGLMFIGTQRIFSTPSYARQTNMSCSACHTMFPSLTNFGRIFKLNGYTLTGIKTIEESSDSTKRGVTNLLKILSIFPLSAMFQASFTHVEKTIPSTQNDVTEFPQQLSLFYSGQIGNHIGTFIQMTYSEQDGTIGMDNTDIRYSNHVSVVNKDLIYGVTLNNNPTVQDVWNSIPAWRFPFSTSDVAPTPSASALIDGALAQQVVGLGAYGLYNNLVYGEISFYRSAQQGTPPPDFTSSGIISGYAPYWRIALEHQFGDNYLELGTSGIIANMFPHGVSGFTNKYTDIGLDLQYEHSFNRSNFIIHSSFVHEQQNLNAFFRDTISQNQTDNLNSLKVDAEIYFNHQFGLTLGYFTLSGSSDNLLYAPGAITGSNVGKPDSDGIIAEFDYMPLRNTKFSVQYIAYNKYNGSNRNYDGFQRNAFDNNTLYLLVWLCF